MKRVAMAVFAIWCFVYVLPLVVHAQTAILIGTSKAGGNTVQVPVLVDAAGNLTIAYSTSGSVISISPNPAFVASYAGTVGMVTVASGSTTSFTSSTSVATTFPIVNITSAAVVLNVTDGAGVYFLKNFSLAANSAVPANWCYGCVFTSGVKISANTASAINSQFNGFQ